MDVAAALKTQYHAALRMLREAIERCPDDLWTAEGYENATWHVAYHAAFYGHLYLMPDEEAFTPWERHREQYEFLGSLPWPPHDPPAIGEPYTREDVLAYVDHVDGLVNATIDATDLSAEACGFWWYELPKLDHLILSIRHVQHHAGQLAERVRRHAGQGVDWAAS